MHDLSQFAQFCGIIVCLLTYSLNWWVSVVSSVRIVSYVTFLLECFEGKIKNVCRVRRWHRIYVLNLSMIRLTDIRRNCGVDIVETDLCVLMI